VLSVTTPDSNQPLVAPEITSVTADSATQVTVNWTYSGTDHEGFKILRKIPGVTPYSLLKKESNPGQGNYLDTTADPNTGYRYVVRAWRTGENGPLSNQVNVTTPDDTPGTTTLETAEVTGSDSVRLTWSYSGSTPTGFKVLHRVKGTSLWIRFITGTDPAQREYVATGLDPGTTYQFIVRAHSATAGNGPISNILEATTDVDGPPAPPTITAAIVLNWEAGKIKWTHPGGTVTGFKVLRKIPGVSAFQQVYKGSDPAQRQYIDTGLTPETTYRYVVRAYIAGVGNSVNSNREELTTTKNGKPVAPVLRDAEFDGSGVALTWSHPGYEITGFKVSRKVNGTSNWQQIFRGTNPSQRSWTDTTFAPGTEYKYFVRAYVAGIGNSKPSNVLTVLTSGPASKAIVVLGDEEENDLNGIQSDEDDVSHSGDVTTLPAGTGTGGGGGGGGCLVTSATGSQWPVAGGLLFFCLWLITRRRKLT
jgi:fibronectin type 3 domain-containing protein